jgi:hypothetical protein
VTGVRPMCHSYRQLNDLRIAMTTPGGAFVVPEPERGAFVAERRRADGDVDVDLSLPKTETR